MELIFIGIVALGFLCTGSRYGARCQSMEGNEDGNQNVQSDQDKLKVMDTADYEIETSNISERTNEATDTVAYFEDQDEIRELKLNATFGVTENSNISQSTTGVPEDLYANYEGDLIGWRRVSIVEFPYVVSIRHARFDIHICTGILVTTRAVLSSIRCVVRRKVIDGRSTHRIIDRKAMIVVCGGNITDSGEHVFESQVESIVTPFENAFRGELMILTIEAVPYSKYHQPVKLSSTNRTVLTAEMEEYGGKSFCEVVTWEDTIICDNATLLIPKFLKSFRVKLLDAVTCKQQRRRLGIRSIGEWSMDENDTLPHCFVGLGGQHCGSAPGAPLICGSAVYGLMALGTSCSEFGDYAYFSPLNKTELARLYHRAHPVMSGLCSTKGFSLWLPIIELIVTVVWKRGIYY